MRNTGRPGALLTESSYLGTLAAVRSFGSAGIPCVVASESRLGVVGWSRHTTQRLSCPSHFDTHKLLAWLLAFGKAHPGHVLYASSDSLAWFYALHRAELCRHFRMYQPDVQVIYNLLNKRRLFEISRTEGIESPRTWFPRTEDDAREIAGSAQFPVLFKPVTQVLHGNNGKGVTVERPEDMVRMFRALARQPYGKDMIAFDPDVTFPLVQELYSGAIDNTYSLSGFVAESGSLLGARAARKILQKPRRVGVGVCFEHAEVNPDLLSAVLRMCRRVGYYGAFEVEFLECASKPLMIDFNPRFYGQMAFDIARGLPVPLLAYHAALGETQQVMELSEAAGRPPASSAATTLCNRLDFETMLRVQRISGGLNGGEIANWRKWHDSHRGRMVDPLLKRDDLKPFVIGLVRQMVEMAIHPRSFLRSTMMKTVLLGVSLSDHGMAWCL